MLERLLKRLPHNYSDDTDSNVGKLLNIIANELEVIHYTMDKIELWHDIDQAKGETLDRIGNNVGEYRRGRIDAVYRVAIKTRIVANLSGGEMPTLNEVMSTIFGDKYIGTIELWDKSEYSNEPAAIIIRSHNVPTFFSEGEEYVRQDILEIAERVVAAGVGVDWEIPKYIISPKIKSDNNVVYSINQIVKKKKKIVNDISHSIAMNFQPSKIDRLNGHHLLNGATNLDAKRAFCINKVNIQEVV